MAKIEAKFTTLGIIIIIFTYKNLSNLLPSFFHKFYLDKPNSNKQLISLLTCNYLSMPR